VVDLAGRVGRTLSAGLAAPTAAGAPGNSFVKAALSTSGKLAYLAAEDGKVYCFDLQTSQLEQTFAAVDTGAAAAAGASGDPPAAKKAKVAGSGAASCEVLAIAHHPHHNLVATAAQDGQLKLWRA
jgi:WD40 repeat protein